MYVGALSPDGLVRVTPLENSNNSGGCIAHSPDGLIRVTPLNVNFLLPDGLVH